MNCSRILPNPPTWLNFEQSRIENWKISTREGLLKAESGTSLFEKLCPRETTGKEVKEQDNAVRVKSVHNGTGKVMQDCREEEMLSVPVPTSLRHFRLTNLNLSQQICVCVKSW